ncbi:hypothetical protein [Staphylococcus xylosus]|uniref:hypothetical protein n=1 Tax=Staphylococcus xylosus TaxID=1288 RepID=UPI003F556F35
MEMNDLTILLMFGIGLVTLDYFVNEFIFGNNKYTVLFKIMLFVVLIILATIAVINDMLAILITMLFLMIVNKLRIIIRGFER